MIKRLFVRKMLKHFMCISAYFSLSLLVSLSPFLSLDFSFVLGALLILGQTSSPTHVLLNFTSQILDGMSHLAANGIVHGCLTSFVISYSKRSMLSTYKLQRNSLSFCLSLFSVSISLFSVSLTSIRTCGCFLEWYENRNFNGYKPNAFEGLLGT